MKKQYIFLISVIVIAGLFFWWSMISSEKNLTQVSSRDSSENEKASIPVADRQNSSPATSDHLVQLSTQDSPFGDPANAEEIKGWFADHGNFSFLGTEYLADYRTYDLDTLIRLSDSGDLKAMYILSERADSIEGVRAVHWKAALYGSTQALIEIGAMNENGEGDLNSLPVERKKEKLIEAFAYYEVAQMRGDWWGNMSSGKSLTDRYQIDFTDEEKQKISDRAKVVYEDLQAKRIQKGLGDFDNSVPDSVIKFYENILRSQTPTKN